MKCEIERYRGEVMDFHSLKLFNGQAINRFAGCLAIFVGMRELQCGFVLRRGGAVVFMEWDWCSHRSNATRRNRPSMRRRHIGPSPRFDP